MSRLITFPNGLWDSQNWLFNMYGVTAEKNSDGTQGNSAPAANKFQVERGKDFIETSGIPVKRNETGCLEMKFAQSISSHYYMTAYCGWLAHNSSNANAISHSPLHDGLCNQISFNYKKYDAAVNSGYSNNRYRCRKIGMSFRDSGGGGYTRDLTPTGGQYWNLMNFGTNTATTTGEVRMSVPTQPRPFGIYFQLETEGSGPRYPDGSYIRIWNLRFYSTKVDEALMLPYQTYSSASLPSDVPLWAT